MEFTFRSEGRERKKRDRMTFVQKGNKGVWLLAIWDSTPVDSPEMKKWEEQVIRMSIEGNTNNIPERPRPRTY
jgi:mRNA degradation ribonuclease J1/J2